MGSALEQSTPRCRRCGASMKAGGADELCACCIFNAALTTMGEEHLAVEASGMLLSPQHFPGYELLGEIARGGMGVVFRARQLRPDRIVAIKVIAAGELASPRMIERFRTEAESAARLDHPNIVPIYEVGHQRGWHFFSMRLIEGCTLGAKLQGRGLSPQDAARLMVKIARAVQHAHERAVLHRDLKPNNILIDVCGEPHLTDFGLAKMLESSVEMTSSNMVLGTLAYMAPEQAAGGTRDVTVAVDIYGLGAVLYEMLTDRPPFEAPTPHALFRMVAEDEPLPPSQVHSDRRKSALIKAVKAISDKRRGVDQILASTAATNALFSDLDAICLKCLEKEPTHRYASAAELADDLERALKGEPIHAQPSTATQRIRKWIRRNPAKAGLIATAAAALLVITAGSVAFNFRLQRSRASAEANAAVARQRVVAQHLREASRLSTEGDVFAGLASLTKALREVQRDSPLEGTVRERVGCMLQFSPKLLRLWNAEGIPVQLRFTSDSSRLAAALRDGRFVVWDLASNSKVLPRDDTERKLVTSVISPDGRHVAEVTRLVPFARIWDIGNGTFTALAAQTSSVTMAAFSVDGKVLATGGERVCLWDVASGAQLPSSLTNNAPVQWLGFRPDGKALLTIDANGNGALWNLEAGNHISFPLPVKDRYPAPCFSPDGRWLLLAMDEQTRLVDALTGTIKNDLPGGMILETAFSADSRFFALASFDDQVTVWETENARNIRQPLSHEGGANRVMFSPDGASIVTGGFDDRLRLRRLNASRPFAFSWHHGALVESVAFSADGRFLAIGDALGVVQVWDLAPRGKTLLPGGQVALRQPLIPDGRTLALIDQASSLRLWDIVAGRETAEPLTLFDQPISFAIERSGTYFAAAFGPSGAAVWDLVRRKQLFSVTNWGVVSSISIAPDSSRMLVIGPEGRMQQFKLPGGEPLGDPMNAAGRTAAIAWSADVHWLAAGFRDLRLWNANSGQLSIDPAPAPQGFQALAFTRKGDRLLVGYTDRDMEPASAQFHLVPSLKPAGLPMRHGDGIASAIFSPDGSLVATGGEDNVARLWRATDGAPAGPVLKHGGIVGGLAFSSDGKFLATGSNDGLVRLWDVANGELAAPPVQLTAPVRSVAFAKGDRQIAAAAHSRHVWVIERRKEELPLDDIERLAVCTTGISLGTDQLGHPLGAAELAATFADLWRGHTIELAWPIDSTLWHEQNALLSEAGGIRCSAVFHLRNLLAAKPGDHELQRRLSAAEKLP